MVKGGQCYSCRIGIGEGYPEPRTYPVGDKEICFRCKEWLEKRGVLRIVADEEDGIEVRVVYLYQDGRIEEIKVG